MEIESREKEKMTLSYYDENAAAFCEGTRNADMSEMRGRFLQYLKPGTLILDAGCGSGRDSKALWKVVIELLLWMAQKKCVDRQVSIWGRKCSADGLRRLMKGMCMVEFGHARRFYMCRMNYCRR